MTTDLDTFFGTSPDSEDISNFSGKGKAKREAKRELKASGLTGKEARQALKSSPCGKKPASKNQIDAWKQCLVDNGLSSSQAELVDKAGGVDNVTDEQLDEQSTKSISAGSDGDNGSKSNVWIYVGIGVGSVAVLGFAAWLIFRKRN